MLPFELTKDTPYLALSGELWSVFVSISTEIDRVIKGFYCTSFLHESIDMIFQLDPQTQNAISRTRCTANITATRASNTYPITIITTRTTTAMAKTARTPTNGPLFTPVSRSVSAAGTIGSKELYLTHWGRDKMDAIFQKTFSSAYSWRKLLNFK